MQKTATVIALLAAYIFALPSLVSATPPTPNVYIVHSYEHNHVCGQPQADGVVAALMDSGHHPGIVSISSYYMDTKNTHTSPQAIRKQAQLALAQIERIKPDVVVTLDDNAFKHVGLALAGRKDVSVVFSGMNGQPETYSKAHHFMDTRERPGSNITGVYEKLHLKRALNVIASIIPSVTTVVGITDYSPTGNAISNQFKIESQEGLPVNWQEKRVRTFEEYKALILAINADPKIQAIYPAAVTLPTEDGKRMTVRDIFRWTLENSTKPEIPINFDFGRLGLFGGASVDFEYMGRLAGTQVASILDGKKAGDLPIIDASNYAIVFNVGRANMLNITIPDDILMASDTVFKTMELIAPSDAP